MEIGHYQQKFILANLKSDEEYALFDKIPGSDANESVSSPQMTPTSPLLPNKNLEEKETSKKPTNFYESTR